MQRITRTFAWGIGLFLVSFGSAGLGLRMGPGSGFANPDWLPTGISLAALFIFGARLWPAIAVAAFAFNALLGMPILVACAVAAGNTLEALLAVALLRKAHFHQTFDRVQDVLVFLAYAALLSTCVSATFGVTAQWLSGMIPETAYVRTWITWWVGDLSSDLVVAPLILVWAARPREKMREASSAFEAVLLLTLLVVICAAVFFDRNTLPFVNQNRIPVYFTFPVVIWAALRFGQHGAVSATFIVSVASIWGASLGVGPYIEATPSGESIASLFLFRAVASVITMILAAVAIEKERALGRVKKWAAVIENAKFGVAIENAATNRFEMVNRAFAAMHGLVDVNLAGQPIALLYSPELRDRLTEHLRQTDDRGHHVYESLHVRSDGTTFPVMIDASAFRDQSGEVRYRTVYIQDITEQKKSEDRLHRLLVDLETAVRVRDEFIEIASHELKTPLTSLKLQTQMTERSISKTVVAQIDPQMLHRRIRQSIRQIDRLSSLVDTMLDLSKIDSGNLDLNCEDTDLAELIHNIVDRLSEEGTLSPTEVAMNIESNVRGSWDRFRMEQVVTNLLSNAHKYGRGNPVEISVQNRDANTVAFAVRDQGIGIGKEDQSRIFRRFERAVPHENITGFGLGLYIAKRLVIAHGGTIEVTSQPGHGAEFSVVLPRYCNSNRREIHGAT